MKSIFSSVKAPGPLTLGREPLWLRWSPRFSNDSPRITLSLSNMEKTEPVSGWNAVEMLKTLGRENRAARPVENKSSDPRPGDFCFLLEHRSRFTESGSSIEMRRIPHGGTKCEMVCAL